VQKSTGEESVSQHHFISYSTVDAREFATRLHDALEVDGVPAWLDKRDIRASANWDSEIDKGLKTCRTLLFVMTPDSVTDNSVCYEEWTRALSFKKPVIPLRLDAETAAPFRLHQRQWIDFSGDFETGLAELREHLRWIDSPAGQVYELESRLKDAQRRRRRAGDPVLEGRIQREIEQLEEDLERQQRIADDPEAARQRTAESIERGLERERQPEPLGSSRATSRFINTPPAVPVYFQDRYLETKEAGKFLKDPQRRILHVIGRGGVGKTAMVVRLLKALEDNRLPDDGGRLDCNGIIYLSMKSARRPDVPSLFADLCEFLPDPVASQMDILYRDAQTPTAEKFKALLHYFEGGRYVVLLDNMEDVLDEHGAFTDHDLHDALLGFLEAPVHAVKLILTSRLAPAKIMGEQPQFHRRLNLDEGLESPHAENVLRLMDEDGSLGLKAMPAEDPLLKQAREHTRGYPRALEALYGILMADTSIGLAEVLADIEVRETAVEGEHWLPEKVVEVMVGEMFSRLDPVSQQVMQALAVYGRPVPPVAVDFLLEPFAPGVDSSRVLRRLVNMHFARVEKGEFYLHPVDQAYALSLLAKGEEPDFAAKFTRSILAAMPKGYIPLKDDIPFTQLALAERAAGYFRQARKPPDQLRSLLDVQAHLNEVAMWQLAGDYDLAVSVLGQVSNRLLMWGHAHLLVEIYGDLLRHVKGNRRADALNSLARAYILLGDFRDAIRLFEEALEICREREYNKLEGTVLNNMGQAYARLGDLQSAIDYYQQALAFAQQQENKGFQGILFSNLGSVYSNLGQVQQAIEYYEQALEIAREVGNRDSEAIALNNLGNTYTNMGEVERGIDYFEQARDIAGEVGNKGLEATLLNNLGSAHGKLGQQREAIENYQQALSIAVQAGNKESQGIYLNNIGQAYNNLGQVERAIDYYKQALDLAQQIGSKNMEGILLNNLGQTHSRLGLLEQAMDYQRQAIAIHRQTGFIVNEAVSLSNLGMSHMSQGQMEEAIEHFLQALEIFRETADRRGEGSVLSNLSQAYANLGELELANDYGQQALEIFREIGDREGETVVLGHFGQLHIDAGDFAQAADYFEPAMHIADEITYPVRQAQSRLGLSKALLLAGEVAKALQTVTAAEPFATDNERPNIFTVKGIVHLHQSDYAAARAAFSTALTHANALLEKTPGLYAALDTKGLALCGLALCEDDAQNHVRDAVTAFQSAREKTRAAGVVARVLRWLDELRKADRQDVLGEAVRLAAGEGD
jgi:tetratricopeptide (TPR) repeat protein